CSAAFSPAEHLAPISGPLLAVKDVGDVEGEAPHSHGFRPRGVSPGASPVPRSVETGDPLALIADKPQQKLRLRPKLAALSRCHRSSPSKTPEKGTHGWRSLFRFLRSASKTYKAALEMQLNLGKWPPRPDLAKRPAVAGPKRRSRDRRGRNGPSAHDTDRRSRCERSPGHRALPARKKS